jgi:hypothetical protein
MAPMLKIGQADYDLMRWEAERLYPRECCGIILGKTDEGCRTVTMMLNCGGPATVGPKQRYSIRPEQLTAAIKLAHTRNENIVGFYHSHAGRQLEYSPNGLLENYCFDCSYVVTSVEQGRALRTESYWLTGSGQDMIFAEEDIEIWSQRPLHPPLT